MNTSILFLLLAIMSPVLLTEASPVHKVSGNRRIIIITTTTDRYPKQPNSYTTTLQINRQLFKAWTTIWFLLKGYVRIIMS